MKVGAVRQSILARILCFVCVCVCVCDSCVGLLCSSHAVLPFVVLLRCNHRTLQVRRVFLVYTELTTGGASVPELTDGQHPLSF